MTTMASCVYFFVSRIRRHIATRKRLNLRTLSTKTTTKTQKRIF